MSNICDNCGEQEAVTSCEFCGSQVCRKCKLENGCKSCDGGVMKF